jgi:hypothetical protein
MLGRMFSRLPLARDRKAILLGLTVLLLVSSTPPLAAMDYFVRPNGDDGARGDSTNAAWRTIERANQAQFKPGDRVLFEAGASFRGNVMLSAEDAGTSNAPVVIGSFGQGRATILAGRQTGITVENAGGVAIENLIVEGAGRTDNTYPYASHTDRGNVVRFNISENDARKNRYYGGLWVRSDGKEMTGVEIYNNTIVMGPWADQAAHIYAQGVNARVRNNIFLGAGPALPLRVEPTGGPVRFENNLYWREGAPTEIAWGAQTYSSLAEWRDRTGQECLGGRPTGLFGSPGLDQQRPDTSPGRPRGLEAGKVFRPLPGARARARPLPCGRHCG